MILRRDFLKAVAGMALSVGLVEDHQADFDQLFKEAEDLIRKELHTRKIEWHPSPVSDCILTNWYIPLNAPRAIWSANFKKSITALMPCVKSHLNNRLGSVVITVAFDAVQGCLLVQITLFTSRFKLYRPAGVAVMAITEKNTLYLL